LPYSGKAEPEKLYEYRKTKNYYFMSNSAEKIQSKAVVRPVNQEDEKVFNEALQGLIGVSYAPVVVSQKTRIGIEFFTFIALGKIVGEQDYMDVYAIEISRIVHPECEAKLEGITKLYHNNEFISVVPLTPIEREIFNEKYGRIIGGTYEAYARLNVLHEQFFIASFTPASLHPRKQWKLLLMENVNSMSAKSGGWSGFSKENMNIHLFYKVLPNNHGFRRTPLYQAKQIVEGTNYMYIVDETYSGIGTTSTLMMYKIFEDLKGNLSVTGQAIQPEDFLK